MMKIDDGNKETRIKPESLIRQPPGMGSNSANDVGRIMADAASETDFAMPGLLANFGRIIAQRMELMEGLPDSVRCRIQDTLGQAAAVPELSAGVGTSIVKGVSGMVLDNRLLMESLRQISLEMEYMERFPSLSELFAASPAGLKTLPQQSGKSPSLIGKEQFQLQDEGPETLQEILDFGLNRLQSVAASETIALTPAMRFAALVDKAVQTGKFETELALWQDTVVSVLDKLADDLEVSEKLANWLKYVDPQVRQLAEASGRPDLIRSWSAIQAWGSGNPNGYSVSAEFLVAKSAEENNAISGFSSEGEKMIANVLRALMTENAGKATSRVDVMPSMIVSRAGRFEYLLSTLGLRSEVMSKWLLIMPELLSEMEKMLQSRLNGKALKEAKGIIIESAPKWLRDMAERTDTSEALEFWAAAKASDLYPWAKLSSTDRRQAMVNLKELVSMAKQQEVFQTMADDSTSRGFVMQAALGIPGQEKIYPALIQVFEEKKERADAAHPEQEVWVRVSIETDYIGTVDLSFRLQDKKYLSIFTRFANVEAASEFRDFLPEIRKALADTALELKKIAVTQIKGERGMENG